MRKFFGILCVIVAVGIGFKALVYILPMFLFAGLAVYLLAPRIFRRRATASADAEPRILYVDTETGQAYDKMPKTHRAAAPRG